MFKVFECSMSKTNIENIRSLLLQFTVHACILGMFLAHIACTCCTDYAGLFFILFPWTNGTSCTFLRQGWRRHHAHSQHLISGVYSTLRWIVVHNNDWLLWWNIVVYLYLTVHAAEQDYNLSFLWIARHQCYTVMEAKNGSEGFTTFCGNRMSQKFLSAGLRNCGDLSG